MKCTYLGDCPCNDCVEARKINDKVAPPPNIVCSTLSNCVCTRCLEERRQEMRELAYRRRDATLCSGLDLCVCSACDKGGRLAEEYAQELLDKLSTEPPPPTGLVAPSKKLNTKLLNPGPRLPPQRVDKPERVPIARSSENMYENQPTAVPKASDEVPVYVNEPGHQRKKSMSVPVTAAEPQLVYATEEAVTYANGDSQQPIYGNDESIERANVAPSAAAAAAAASGANVLVDTSSGNVYGQVDSPAPLYGEVGESSAAPLYGEIKDEHQQEHQQQQQPVYGNDEAVDRMRMSSSSGDGAAVVIVAQEGGHLYEDPEAKQGGSGARPAATQASPKKPEQLGDSRILRSIAVTKVAKGFDPFTTGRETLDIEEGLFISEKKNKETPAIMIVFSDVAILLIPCTTGKADTYEHFCKPADRKKIAAKAEKEPSLLAVKFDGTKLVLRFPTAAKASEWTSKFQACDKYVPTKSL